MKLILLETSHFPRKNHGVMGGRRVKGHPICSDIGCVLNEKLHRKWQISQAEQLSVLSPGTKANPPPPFSRTICVFFSSRCYTFPETNIFAPGNGCLEDDCFLLGWPIFRGHVSFREGMGLSYLLRLVSCLDAMFLGSSHTEPQV